MKLRDDANFIPELNFDMEKEKRIIGQNIFVKEKIVLKDGSKLPVTTMGPIRIANDLKKRGFGIKLLYYSIERTKGYGCKVLFLKEISNFYGKSGFVHASSKGIGYHGLSKGMKLDFFLCKKLEKGYLVGMSGIYPPPKRYFVSEVIPEFCIFQGGKTFVSRTALLTSKKIILLSL